MVSFLQLIIIYTFVLSLIYVALIEVVDRRVRGRWSINDGRQPGGLGTLFLAAGVSLYLIPPVVVTAISKYSYPTPDTYNYVAAIEDPGLLEKLSMDPFYKAFPLYIVLGYLVREVTGTNAHFSLLMAHLASLLVALACILLIALRGRESTNKLLFLLLYPLVLANTVYLYSYVGAMIPQTFAIGVLLLLLYLATKAEKRSSWRDFLIFIIVLILSLSHFGVIPTFIIAMLIIAVIETTYMRRSRSSFTACCRGIFIAVVLAMLVHTVYTLYAYSLLSNIANYISYYVQLLYRSVLEPPTLALGAGSGGHGFHRPFQYLNALALASFLSLAVAGLYLLLKRREIIDATSLSYLLVGGVFVAVGFLKLYVVREVSSWSIARYVNIYGFLLLSLYNEKTLLSLLAKRKVAIYTAIMLLIGFIGALLDPFTFPDRPSMDTVLSAREFSDMVREDHVIVCFRSGAERFSLGPPLYLWLVLEGKNVDLRVCPYVFNELYNVIYSAASLRVALKDAGVYLVLPG